MKTSMSPEVRIMMSEHYNALSNIKQIVENRVRAEFANETSAIRGEIESLLSLERDFKSLVESTLTGIDKTQMIRIETQVGPGSTIVNTYDGYLEKQYLKGTGYFNFICADKNSSKPFTVGLSCLLSVETL